MTNKFIKMLSVAVSFSESCQMNLVKVSVQTKYVYSGVVVNWLCCRV